MACTLYGTEFEAEGPLRHRRNADLPEAQLYSKERKLIEEIRKELAEGRRCQVFAVYTQKRDVAGRLARILSDEGIRAADLLHLDSGVLLDIFLAICAIVRNAPGTEINVISDDARTPRGS